MRSALSLLASVLCALALTACGGAELASEDPNSSDYGTSKEDLNGECHFPRAAHCFCKLVGGDSMTTGSPDSIIPAQVQGQDLFSYVIPGKCYSQAVDWANSHFDRGCWKDCRDAFGVDGHPRDPEVTQLEKEEGQRLRAGGACGGWMSAPLLFSAGTNKWKADTNMGIGIGIGGSVVVVNGKKTCR